MPMPDQLYERGEGAKAFERTASRLEEMQSTRLDRTATSDVMAQPARLAPLGRMG